MILENSLQTKKGNTMKHLVFDPRFGAAGDMILSSLLAVGADYDAVLRAISSVSTPVIEETLRAGMPALYIKTETAKTHRTLEDIIKIIDAADAPVDAKTIAKRVFSRIQEAEEAVHQTHHVHFHEVGADDAIADVLGSCTALLSLDLAGVAVLPVSTGFGSVSCSHGVMPVPAPATANILQNSKLDVNIGGFEGELCTPTGAALLAEFADSFSSEKSGASEKMGASEMSGASEKKGTSGKILAIGRGAGTRNPDDHPNILTVYLMSSDKTDSHQMTQAENQIDVLETNVDDVTGEVISESLTQLMDAGARDVSVIPIIMKKGRAGHLIRVVCMPEDSERLAKLLARETGSLGIRCLPMIRRFVANRCETTETAVINGKVYTASVKHAEMDGVIYSRKAEFDDCKRIASDAGVSVREVKRIFEGEAWNCQ